MRIIKKHIQKILKFFGFKIIPYDKSNLTQLNLDLKDLPKNKDIILKSYISTDRKIFPIYRDYRYGLKKSYLSYSAIKNLFYLSKMINRNKKIQKNLNDFIGTHTLTCPINEINDYSNKIIRNYSDFFVLNNEKFIPKVNESEFFKQLKNYIKWTKRYLSFYKLKSKLKILEVGCGTGMLSNSLSLLGHEVHAIDKNYHNIDFSSEYLRMKFSKMSGAKVNYVDGDITKYDKFNNNYFDLIISISVLEHIKNLPLSFEKMKNLLKKDGVLLHRYGHFWSEEGAHSLGNLDSPWLHTIIKENELVRYLRKVRPFEYKFCLNWYKKCLNTKINSSYVQKELAKKDFLILDWKETKNNKDRLRYLDGKLINQILQENPQISISDLLCSDTTFLARKSK